MTATVEEFGALLTRRGIVETHFHVGPEVIPRRYDILELARTVREANATLVAKNHMFATTALSALARHHTGARLLGGIVLNNYVGGLNPDAIHAAAAANKADVGLVSPADPPFVVWMPTVHAASHLRTLGHAFDPRWSGCCDDSATGSTARAVPIAPVEATDPSGRPSNALLRVLDAVAETGAVLATGHLAASEIMQVVPTALDRGVRSVIVTHPHYPSVALTDDQLVALTHYPNVFIEHCFAIHTIEQVPLESIATSIVATGCERVVLSTDFGQQHSPPFPEATARYAHDLARVLGEAVTCDELMQMFTANGAAALDLNAAAGQPDSSPGQQSAAPQRRGQLGPA